MKSKVLVILPLLTVLVIAIPANASPVDQGGTQPPEIANVPDDGFNRGIGQIVVGGLTLYLLMQMNNKK